MIASDRSPSHPVAIECPRCNIHVHLPLVNFSLGDCVRCLACGFEIHISSHVIRQLLQQIDTDLRTPEDLPLQVRPSRRQKTPSRLGANEKETPPQE